jgi:membrane protein required for colicin V production
MFIDIVFLFFMIMAVIKGYSKGFILALFSIIALIVGLAAAIKLSTVTASWLQDSFRLTAKWLTLFSFVLVFLLAVFLVRLGARALEKTVEMMMLGWVNRLAGILLYAILYTVILSVLVFYIDKIGLIKPEAMAESKTYSFIKPWGPGAMNVLGTVLPFFKNMFMELEKFFDKVKQ